MFVFWACAFTIAKRVTVLINTVTKYVSEWIMIIALIGLVKKYLNFSGNVSSYMNKRSFLFYIYHFIWVVLFQYILYGVVGDHSFVYGYKI